MDKIFFHIDVNSAFLSWSAVEELNKGSEVDLRTIPSIVGGDRQSRHGIVLAKSVPAKKYNISTAEPIVSALKKCPNLVMVPPDFNVYRKMSHGLMNYLHSISPDLEQASIDECYMDFTPIAHLYSSPLEAADMIRNEVFKLFGFTVNVGISDKKVLAKMASDFTKPDRTHTLYSYEIKEKMWPLPVGDLFLCGKSAAETLKKLDIKTIGDLATADLGILTSHLKSHGKTLWEFANGIDDSGIVIEPPETKGIGNSTTCPSDIEDYEEASRVIYNLCESVSNRLNKANFYALSITTEIKYSTFKSVSHQCSVQSPIGTTKAIHEVAMSLFDSLWNGEPIRLLGVRATKLVDKSEPIQLSLFDLGLNTSGTGLKSSDTSFMPSGAGLKPSGVGLNLSDKLDTQKQKNLDAALRSIRERFGKDAVKRAVDADREIHMKTDK